MKKYIVFLFFAFLIQTFCYSQNDSTSFQLADIEKISDSVSFNNAYKTLVKTTTNKKYDEALIYANKLLEVAKLLQNDIDIGKVHQEIGIINRYKNQKIKAISSFEQARIYFKKANYLIGAAEAKRYIGALEHQLGNLEKGADYLLDATMDFMKLNDSIGLINVYNNLANIYTTTDDFENAKKYYKKSLALIRAMKEPRELSLMNNLSYLYIDEKKPDSAKIILDKALKIGKKRKNFKSVAQSYSLSAKVHIAKKDYLTAKKYYDSTLLIGDKAEWKMLMVNAEQQMGLVSLHLKNYKKADKLITSARKKFTNFKSVPSLLKNYELSAKLDSARGDYASALAWQKKHQKLSDKKTSESTKKKISFANARYEEKLRHLKQIDEQSRKAQEDKAALFRYKIFIYVVLGILLITTILLFTIIKNRKERKKYITQLNESNEIKNKLFSIISHDLKNEISGLDASLSLMEENAFSPEEFKEIIPLLSNRTHQTSILLNNLLNWSKSQMKELNARPVLFDITEVITNKFNYFKPSAEQKNIKLINKLAPTVIYADKDMFSIIAQNLIANAVKFCDSGDSVTLASEELDKHYRIHFIDTGVGIHDSKIHKLFSEDTFTTTGTQNETGTGLGLKICKELTELNSGEIKVESSVGSGSTFSVLFPKAS